MTQLATLKSTAVEAIRRAFPVEAPPSAAEMENDHCPECREIASIFVGRRWTDVVPHDLLGNPGPSLLTDRAFEYYLPAMMCCCIEAPDELDCLPAAVVSELSPPRARGGAHRPQRLAAFGRDQAAAIVSFLRFTERWMREDAYGEEAADVYEDVAVDKVLERALEYWSERLSSDVRAAEPDNGATEARQDNAQ